LIERFIDAHVKGVNIAFERGKHVKFSPTQRFEQYLKIVL